MSSKGPSISFRGIRIILLLVLLVSIAGMTYWERLYVRSWTRPLDVEIYPIDGDGSDKVRDYLEQLHPDKFQPIADFIQSEGSRRKLKPLPPVRITLHSGIVEIPPLPPLGNGSALLSILWSLKMRYYALRHTPFWNSLGKIRLFVVYHEGEAGKPLQHSLGLQKGLVGVVHVFASKRQNAQNDVVIAHELLHTLGATDKYGPDGFPKYPEGFGDPDAETRYPQFVAEIMAGRIAVSPGHAEIPPSLAECVIGYKTAYEINW